MTSEEIKKYKMLELGVEYQPLWLKEIAYQLAVMNERGEKNQLENGAAISVALCATNDLIPIRIFE